MPNRRHALLTLAGLAAALPAAALPAATRSRPRAALGGAPPAAPLTPDEAVARLMAGNGRYVADRLTHPDDTPARRAALATEQHPFAVVLACADSRVPPELVFDEGLGDLFTVRVAGNVLDDAVVGSIEYAAEHLGVPAVLVLGHERCGAVTAAVQHSHEAHIATLARAIQPAVALAQARVRAEGGDLVDHAVRENVQRVVAQLRASRPILAGRVADGRLRVAGGYYGLGTGAVTLIA